MGLHINPLKKRKTLYLNDGRPKEKEEHMSWKDAAIVSLVLTLFQVFTVFLTLYDWSRIVANPNVFLFDFLKFAGSVFFTTFVALTGLAKLSGN